MKTLIYSMSLNGEISTTLASLRFISDTHKDDVFEELIMPKNGVLTEEMLAQFRDVDLVMLASSLYHFAFSSQAMDSLKVVGDYLRKNNPNVAVTLFTTSAFAMESGIAETTPTTFPPRYTPRSESLYAPGVVSSASGHTLSLTTPPAAG